MAATFTDGFLETTDGASIYYQMKGNPASLYPLILLHGGESSENQCKGLTSWDPQFDVFSQYYTVIRLDMRGCGRSSFASEDPFRTWQWLPIPQPVTLDVIELMAKLEINQAHILGLSIGSAIAAQIAVFYPDKVGKLILAAPWANHTLPRDGRLQALKDITDKTLLIGGDDQYDYEWAWATSQSYSPLSIFMENNNGHFINRDQPDLFNQSILEFLASADSVTDLITHYYVSILERQPEATGVTFWRGWVAQKQVRGEDAKDVFRTMADFFFNSPEYTARNTTDRQFITNLYLTFFQRQPDETGYAYWLDQLAKGLSRNEAIYRFLFSPEFTLFTEQVLNP